eukprot:14450066-Alexandrium_andersonii.AAC.1
MDNRLRASAGQLDHDFDKDRRFAMLLTMAPAGLNPIEATSQTRARHEGIGAQLFHQPAELTRLGSWPSDLATTADGPASAPI